MASSWPLALDWKRYAPSPSAPAEEWMWPAGSRSDGPGLRALGPGGRFRLEGIAWQGGQADIWTAIDEQDGGRVAIKVLRPDLRGSRQLATLRMVREARILGTLNGDPRVMDLIDYGPAHIWTGEPPGDPDAAREPWLAMPLLEHVPLADALATDGPFDEPSATALARALAAAIAHAHDHDVVHRDISPGNVLLTRTRLVLSDFGVAWTPGQRDDRLETASSNLTEVDGRPRTAGWFAPEILAWDGQGAPPDRSKAVDVFNWGLFVHTLVLGRHPWAGGDNALDLDRGELERMYQPRPARPQLDGAPPVLRGLIVDALCPDPTGRPTAHDLLAVLDGGRRRRPALRSRPRVVVGAVVAAALVVASGGVAWSTGALTLGAADPCAPAHATSSPVTVSPAPSTADPDNIVWAEQPEFTATGAELYTQSFADGTAGWPMGRTPTYESRTDGCAYIVRPLAKGDAAYLAAPAPDEALAADVTVEATATLRAGQGFWGVWCRGVDKGASAAYYFQISHTSAVRILVLDGTPYGGGVSWKHLDGVDVTRPTTITARCADVPGAPVQLTMAVNGREVLSFRPGTGLLGPGYAGVLSATFGDVDGPTAQEGFTRFAIRRFR